MAGEASGSGGGGAASLVPLTECPICFLTYTRPLQLSCGHTLCASCVDGLVNQVRDPANRHMIEVDQMLNDLREEEDNAEQQRAAGNWPYQGDGQVGLGGQLVRLQQGLQQLPPPGVRNEGFIPIGGAAALANILEGRRANGNPIGVGGGVGQQRDRRLFGAGYELVGYGPARRNTGTTIKCPECRKPTHVPQDGLPVNYRLQELIEQVTAVEEAAEASRAAEAEAARNKLLLDPNKCNKCNEVITGDTIFSCANINCVDAEVLCSTCCIRYHNGHVIRETKALTEKDLLETKNRIGEQTGRAYDVIERIQLSVKKFSNHAFAVKHVLAKSVKSFEDIAGGLESLSENSLESLNLKEQKAVELADQFEKMLTKCGELSDGLKEHIDELVKEHEEYMRMNGYDIKNEVDETEEDLGGGVDTDVAVTYQNNNGDAVVAAGGEAMDMDEAAVPPPPPVVLPAAGNEDPVARQLNLPQPLRVPRLIHQALRRHRGIVVPRVAPPPGPGAAAGGAGPNPAGAAPRPPALPPVPLPPALPPVPHPPALPPVPHPPALPAAPHPPALPAAAPAARPLPFNPLGVGPFNPALAAAIDYIQPAQRAMEILQQELHQRVDNGFNAQLRQQYQQMQHNHMQRQVANDQPLAGQAGQAAANAVAEQAAAAVNYANQYNQQLQQRQQQQQPQQQLLAQQQQAMAQRVQQHVQQHMQQQQQVQQQIQHHQQQYAQHNQQLQQQLMRDQWRPYHPRPMDNQPQYQYQQPPLAPPQQQPQQQQQQQQNAPIQGQQHFVLHRYHGRNQPDAGYIPVNQPQQQQPRQMQQQQQQQQQQQARAQLANHLAQILHPPQEGAVRLRMGHEERLRDGQDEEAPALFHNVEDDQYGGGLPIVPQGAEEQQANPEMLMGFNLAGAGINIHPLPAIEGENEEINGEEEENDGMNALNDHQYAALEIDRIEDDEGGNVRRRVEEEHQQVIDALGNITRDHTNEQVERLLNTERLLRMQRRALRMAHEPGMYLDIRREAERFLEYVRRPNNIREVRRDNVENVAEANLADEEENNEEEEEGMRDGEDGQIEGDGVGEILADADDAENQREDIQNLREQAERIHISPRRRAAGKAAEQAEQQENRRITRSRSQDADEDDNNGLYPIAGDHLSQGNGRPNKKRKADAKTEEIGGSITRRTRSATQLAVQDRPSTSKQPIMRNIAEEGEDEE